MSRVPFRRVVPVVLAASALLLLVSPRRALAAPEMHHRREWAGAGSSIRPFIGFTSDLGVSAPTPFADGTFLFGADYAIGDRSGLTIIPGMRLGTGLLAFTFTPVLDVAWRFRIRRAPALVPYVGVGAALRMGTVRYGGFAMALAFRFFAGIDLWLPQGFGIGMKLVIPEIGPMLTPYVVPVGAVELTIGPRFRF